MDGYSLQSAELTGFVAERSSARVGGERMDSSICRKSALWVARWEFLSSQKWGDELRFP